MINGSFVFGLDDDDKDVFQRTVDWAVGAYNYNFYFSILTPYPGTKLYQDMEKENSYPNWDLYDTRHVVYQTNHLSPEELERGYYQAYDSFIPGPT